MEALFTLYGVNELGLSKSASAFSLTFFSLSFVLSAIPSGLLGAKFGKKKVIVVGIIGLIISFTLLNWVESVFYLRAILFMGGLFWACVNINAYPFIISTGSSDSFGTRTGLYYLVSSLAAIVSPPTIGLFIDLFGFSVLFITAACSLLLALGCISRVTDRESGMEDLEKV